MNEIDFQHDLLPLKDKLFRVALRITLDRPEAEDVVEDTLVRVWERRKALGAIGNLETYCLTICRNLAIDRAERKVAQHLPIADDDTIDEAPRPDEQMEQQQRLQWVHEAFQRLPEKQRTALQLRDIDGHSYGEVAEVMNITEADVKVTLHRARNALKQQLLATKSMF